MENSINKEEAAVEASKINVTLQKNEDGNDVLRFDGAPKGLDIDFSEDNQSSLRKLFCWLLDSQLKQRARLALVKDPSVKNVTYQKVAEDYINDLNAEIDSFFDNEASLIDEVVSPIDFKIGEDAEDGGTGR